MAWLTYSFLALAWLGQVQAAFSKDSSSNVAVFWGQNGYGASHGGLEQKSLATYCENTDIDVILLAFLTEIATGTGSEPVLNFANLNDGCTVFYGTDLIDFSGAGPSDCANIGADITTCQKTHGKTILLSIGGATYTEGGFSSPDAATSAAEHVWEIFGPQQKESSAPRPFGDAVIDGFDFDFESSVSNTVPFTEKLRALFATDTSKPYYLTATPQCPYPDAATLAMLSSGVHFDAVFVQFYNNFCGLQSYEPGAAVQWNFMFDAWDAWAKETSANKEVKVFLGVPGGPEAAPTGYEDVGALKGIVEYCKGFESFGGVMVWDASAAYANEGFLEGVTGCLKSEASEAGTAKKVKSDGERSSGVVGDDVLVQAIKSAGGRVEWRNSRTGLFAFVATFLFFFDR